MPTRTWTVTAKEAGQTVVDWLRAKLSLPAGEVQRLLRSRKVRVGGTPCSNPAWRLRAGQRVEVDRPAAVPAGPRPRIRYLDDDIVVVDKPSGLTTMRHAEDVAEHGPRAKRFLPDTLQDRLPALIADHTGRAPGQVRAVHRLDKETSGLVVFARHVTAERLLGDQFRAHTVERKYLALVRGRAVDARLESSLVKDRGDGRRGSGEGGQHAVTHVRVLEELGAFTLVECRLETGRTHQVRIHLGEAGSPLCGERVYDRPLHGRPLPDGSGIERVALHAATLGLDHPATGRRMNWESPLPADLATALERLRRSRPSPGGAE